MTVKQILHNISISTWFDNLLFYGLIVLFVGGMIAIIGIAIF